MVKPNVPLDERIDLINRNDPSVTKFELEYHEGWHMTEDHIRALFRGMLQNTHIRELDLRHTPCELRRTVCVQRLPQLLQQNSSIEHLRFPWKMMNAEFLPAVDALYNNYNNRTMKTLSLFGCDICGRDSGEMIGRLIRNNHHIKTIDLYGNTNLGPAGASQIAAALGDDDCALKTLYLNVCGIGDEGVDALCTALQVNDSLETFRFEYNKITDKGYQAVARFLPRMSGLKEIHFVWEPPQVSAVVLQQMMDGLQKNQSLHRITPYGMWGKLSAEQCREWSTCCAFVRARNKMKGLLFGAVRDRMRVAERQGSVAAVPIPIGLLLRWCCRQGHAEVQASLIHPLLCSRANEIAKLAEARLNLRNSKRRLRKVDYSQM